MIYVALLLGVVVTVTAVVLLLSVVRVRPLRPYLDARLVLFVALAAGASVISSHGALLFFRYLVDPWLAWVFIGVVALGIIGLDAAGTLERGWRRAPYYAGMFVFLALETLANYFAGQAGFVARIVAQLPPSSDLRALAEGHPYATRSLVVLFLAMASIAVALFTFAAATRFGQLRKGEAGRLARAFARLRKRYSAVVRALGTLRTTVSAQSADLAALRTALDEAKQALAIERSTHAGQSARLRRFVYRVRARNARLLRRFRLTVATLEMVRAERDELARVAENRGAALDEQARQYAAEADEFRAWSDEQVARSAAAFEKLDRQRYQAEDERDQARAEAANLLTELSAVRKVQQQTLAELTEAEGIAAQLRNDVAEARALSVLDVKAIAQALRDEGVPLRTIGAVLGVSEKTIRNWTNAQLKEVA